jgi:hypothetical protein
METNGQIDMGAWMPETFINRVKISALSMFYFGNPEKFIDQVTNIPDIDLVQPRSEHGNCFSYALDRKYVGLNTVLELILKRDFCYEPKEGDHAWYFSTQSPTHIGLVEKDGRIKSKWGNGPILLHPVWKIPLSYGDRVKYTSPPSLEEIQDLINRTS